MSSDDRLTGQIARLVAVRKQLEQAAAVVLREAADVSNLPVCGTDELPAALSALESAEYVDAEEDAARWVARAFTVSPAGLLRAGVGEPELALCGAVMMLRAALADLDSAKQ